jgi:thiamine-phosphate pyrophosphorylase
MEARMKELIAITNRRLCEKDFLDQIKRIADAGFDRIILREKDLAPDAYQALAEQVVRALESYETICTLHSFHEVAVKLQVKSIHLPLPLLLEKESAISIWMQQGHPEQKESSLPEDCEGLHNLYEVGSSIHSVEELQKVKGLQERLHVNHMYITASHVFPTECKKNLPARGIPFLETICKQADMPIYALGGIAPENLERVFFAGADGACLMSYTMRASEKELKEVDIIRRKWM